ncbi:MAG TPA: ribose-phosphate diphosphokinase [Bacteroidales bacterium]
MGNSNADLKIFAGSSSVHFLDKMCGYLEILPGNSESFHFSEGNSYVKILENVREKDIYIVETIGLNANDSLVELLFWIDAFKRSSANSVTVIIPFFSYAKGDKKDEPRVSIRARVCADCLEVAGADRIITMDLHSPQIQGFFKVPVDHLYAYPLLCEYIKSLSIPDLVIVSPDAGFAKSARRFSSYLNLPTVICDKTRADHSEKAEVIEIIGNVKGKNAFIVDDFTITCGTIVDTARILRENGAKTINAMVTHAMLAEKGLKHLENSEIDTLVITDTVYNPLAFNHKKIKTISVAPLFAEAVRIIHDKESLSALFDHLPDKVLDFAFRL